MSNSAETLAAWDLYAASALSGLISGDRFNSSVPSSVAKEAGKYADAMLAIRAAKEEKLKAESAARAADQVKNLRL